MLTSVLSPPFSPSSLPLSVSPHIPLFSSSSCASPLTPAALAFSFAANAQAPRIIAGPAPMPQNALRTSTPAGPTLMPLIRQIQTCMPNGSPHPGVMTQGPESGLIYASPYDYPYTLAPATSILEYPIDSSGVLGKHACPCDCPAAPHQHYHPHGQWNPAPTLILRHSS